MNIEDTKRELKRLCLDYVAQVDLQVEAHEKGESTQVQICNRRMMIILQEIAQVRHSLKRLKA